MTISLSRELLANFKSASAALVFEALGAHDDALSAAEFFTTIYLLEGGE